MQKQKQEQNHSYAPGFLEWRRVEDDRISKLQLMKIEKEEQEAKDKEAATAGCPLYYKRLAKEAHANWELAGFKPGPLREAYMDAHAALVKTMQPK
jgi:hypothetical protein